MSNFDLKNFPRQVWAYYHPFYGTPDGPTCRWLTWNEPLGLSRGYGLPAFVPSAEMQEHLKHDASIFLGPGRKSNYSVFYPTLGLYDCLDPSTLEQHACWAVKASLDGLLWDYMLVGEDNSDKGKPLQETIYDRSLRLMLEVLERLNVRLALCPFYDSFCWYSYPAKRIAKELTYLVNSYHGHPRMLHFENRLVVYIYSTLAKHSILDWRRIRRSLDTTGAGRHIFLVACGIRDPEFNEPELFDGFGDYSYGLETLEGYRRAYKRLRQIADRNRAKFWSATLAPGFDGRIWHHPGRVVARGMGRLYESIWEQAIKEQPHFITICSFNEWGEGTQIEPCLEYEDFYLKLTAKWAKIFRQGDIKAG